MTNFAPETHTNCVLPCCENIGILFDVDKAMAQARNVKLQTSMEEDMRMDQIKNKYKSVLRKCPHGKQKSRCKDCGGSGICEHQKERHRCKECGGSQICKHEKRKDYCRECNPNRKKYILRKCPHGKEKKYCRACGGSAFCEHGKEKKYCKACGGSGICEHGKYKKYCKACGGSGICEHGKERKFCKACGGSGICEHGKIKFSCRLCGGSAFCEHDKLKTFCKVCDGKRLCKSSWCETTGNAKYNGYCAFCCVNLFPDIKVARNYKTKENEVVSRVKSLFPEFSWVCDKKVLDGCSLRRPDLLLDMGTHIIIVEVDENKHSGYDCSCENKRLMEISQDSGHRPIVFIRFNPDGYTDTEGKKITSCWSYTKQGLMSIKKAKLQEWEERIEVLKNHIQYWIDNSTEKTIKTVELFY